MYLSNRTITIICEACGKRFNVPKANETNQKLIIDFAVCTHCNTPRRPAEVARFLPDELCLNCNVPRGYFKGHPSKELCERCYYHLRKLRRAHHQDTNEEDTKGR